MQTAAIVAATDFMWLMPLGNLSWNDCTPDLCFRALTLVLNEHILLLTFFFFPLTKLCILFGNCCKLPERPGWLWRGQESWMCRIWRVNTDPVLLHAPVAVPLHAPVAVPLSSDYIAKSRVHCPTLVLTLLIGLELIDIGCVLLCYGPVYIPDRKLQCQKPQWNSLHWSRLVVDCTWLSVRDRAGCHSTRALRASTHATCTGAYEMPGTGQSAVFLVQSLIWWIESHQTMAGHSSKYCTVCCAFSIYVQEQFWRSVPHVMFFSAPITGFRRPRRGH